jgi:hypothetical protein
LSPIRARPREAEATGEADRGIVWIANAPFAAEDISHRPNEIAGAEVAKASRSLTDKQRAFVEEYLRNGRNAAAAYRVAYRSKASPQTVATNADRLLEHTHIAPIIAAADAKAKAATAKVLDRYERKELRLKRLADLSDEEIEALIADAEAA